MALSLADLARAAAEADGPSLPTASTTRIGGVDPLGLRQINFDLMDQVLPGLNNVARHVRPFVVVAWAWRRAAQLAAAEGLEEVGIDLLRDFVDRIEVIYAWSQFLRDPNADLPGRQVLATIVSKTSYVFGGEPWRRRRTERRYSTAFSAPITYGPALKSLGWLEPHPSYPGVLIATAASTPALDAFEAAIADRLTHPAFNQFGSVKVTASEAASWSKAWALDRPTKAERRVAAEALAGATAHAARRDGVCLMVAAADHIDDHDADEVRRVMCGPPSNFSPPALNNVQVSWRRVQNRQLFRLALEGLFYWLLRQLDDGPQRTESLVANFMHDAGSRAAASTARDWLTWAPRSKVGPADLLVSLQEALWARDGKLAPAIAEALRFALAEAPETPEAFERMDRLPLPRARREAAAWAEATPAEFLRHVIETWVLAQHVYWSIGRGLADARSGGKRLLRLRVVLEEGGWTQTAGTSTGTPPAATPDRLVTALSLARECGLLA